MIKNSIDPLKFFVTNYPLRALIVVLALLISSISEGIGIIALLPVLQFVMQGEIVGNSNIGQFIENIFEYLGVTLNFENTLIFIVVIIALKAFFRLIAMYIVSSSAADIAADFRTRLIKAIMKARWSYFTGKPSGHISTAMNNEPLKASNCIVKECSFIAEAIQITVYLVIAMFLSWTVTLCAIFFGIVGTALLSAIFKMAREAGQDQTDSQKSLMTNILDGISVMKPVRAMAREEYFLPFVKKNIQSLNASYRRLLFSPHAIGEGNEIIKVIGLSIGLYIMMDLWVDKVESMFLLAVLFMRVLQRLSVLQKYYVMIVSLIPAFCYTLESILEAEKEEEQWVGNKIPDFQDKLQFKKISYAHQDKEIFKGASFNIDKEKFTIITGDSGLGKSTLVDLICGLYEVSGGEICIGKDPIHTLDIKKWRENIGYVPQDSILFNDTIRNNITLHDGTISNKEVMDALEKSGAADFVKAQGGLDAQVGEDGSKLSGGQKQRIAIARALVRDPELLILDEATTGLDKKTELSIFEELQRLKGTVTIIAITHNQALREYADEVMVLGNHTMKKL